MSSASPEVGDGVSDGVMRVRSFIHYLAVGVAADVGRRPVCISVKHTQPTYVMTTGRSCVTLKSFRANS